MRQFISRFLTILSFFYTLIVSPSHAQVGGTHTYAFLDLPASARVASLGGYNISIKDRDPNLAYQNPALLNDSMSRQLAFNMVNYFTDVKYGYASYSHSFKNCGTYSGGVHFINYGEFQRAEVNGDLSGTFTASEYAVHLGWGKQLNSLNWLGFSGKLDSLFSVGVNVKAIFSQFEIYSSNGIAADLGLNYYRKKSQFSASLVIRNYGRQLTTYSASKPEPLPLDISFGITKKLAKAPLRFSLTAQHLERFDLTYDSTVVIYDPFTNLPIERTSFDTFKDYADMAMRHMVVGVELLLSKNFHIRGGFNYRRRAELQLSSRTSVIGFSGGLGLRISKFHLSYGVASYHLAGASHHFSFTTNVSDFYSKKK